jgi:hypothetical protein
MRELFPSFETEACFFPNSGRGQICRAHIFFPISESDSSLTSQFARGIKTVSWESSWIETIASP